MKVLVLFQFRHFGLKLALSCYALFNCPKIPTLKERNFGLKNTKQPNLTPPRLDSPLLLPLLLAIALTRDVKVLDFRIKRNFRQNCLP